MAEALSVVKLNNENYGKWKFKMEMLLIKDDLWCTIVDEPPTIAEQLRSWKKKDDKARAIIGLAVEDGQVNLIKNAKSAKEVWNELKQYHEKATLTNEVIFLKQLCLMRYDEGGDMEDHLVQMDNLIDKITALGLEIPDRLKIALMLCSLPDSYSPLVTALEVRPVSELTANLVKNAVIAEYKRRQGQLKTGDTGELALKVNRNNEKDVKCFFCHRRGHIKPNCRKYLKWKSETKKLRAHAVKTDSEDSDISESSFLDFAFIVHNNKRHDVWFFDSGASKHMTNDVTFFTQLNTNYRSNVRVANKQTSQVYGIGAGKLKCVSSQGVESSLELDDVLYVPDFENNLISISMLDKNGFSASIQGGSMKIFRNSKEVAVGDVQSGMYELRLAQNVSVAKETHASNCIHQWHRRLAHRHPDAIKRLEVENLANGIHIEACGVHSICESCVKGKMTRAFFPKHAKQSTTAARQLIHTDLCGPMPVTTAGGRRYIMTFVDDYSRHCQIFLLSNKSEVFRSDRGGEYLSHELRDYMQSLGIERQFTAPYSPQQNGIAERRNRYLLEATRTMLIEAHLEKKYWGETVMTVCYLQNRLPTKTKSKTPFELWYGVKPCLSHLKVFGCKAFAHIPKEKRRKLDSKATAYTFVGYSQESKAYRLLDKESGRIIISRDVIFIEHEQVGNETEMKIDINEQNVFPEDINEENISQPLPEPPKVPNTKLLLNTSVSSRGRDPNISLDDVPLSVRLDQLVEDTLGPSPNISTSDCNLDISQDKTDHNMDVSYLAEGNSMSEPRCPEEALSGPNADQWKKAMIEEIQSLEKNNTWTLEKIPKDKKPIGCRWVFKIKKNSEGKPIRFKARLVAQGFSQKFGQDYDEIFAPVVKHTTFRVLLSIAGNRNYLVRHLDAKTAFLNGLLKEDIYMKQPPMFLRKDQEHYACKLKRSIYGLKQSAKVWHDTLNESLQKLGFKPCQVDPCLFKRQETTGDTFIVVHVDDIIAASSEKRVLDKLCDDLNNQFSITDLGDLKCYLGINVRRTKSGDFFINQSHYIEKLLREARLSNAKTSNIPMDTGYLKIRSTTPRINNPMFQKLIGSLLYLSVNTRPDISAPVTILSQHIKDTRQQDWNELQRVVRYLKNTSTYELLLNNSQSTNKQLFGYADANWAESREDRKSNSGYLFKVFGGTVSWSCKKQDCVSVSSTEAEIVALAEACREAVWLRELLDFFEEKQLSPTVIHEDNQSCINSHKTSGLTNRSKHIDVKHYYARDLEKKNIIKLKYCPSEFNQADILTKPTGATKLKTIIDQIGIKKSIQVTEVQR